MKTIIKRACAAILSVSMLLSAPSFGVQAGAEEYSLQRTTVSFQNYKDGYLPANDCYAFHGQMFYSCYRDIEGSSPSEDVYICQSGMDGSGARDIVHFEIKEADGGSIALVTNNFILYNYGFFGGDRALMIDRRNGALTEVEPYDPIGGYYAGDGKDVTQQVGGYYLMMRGRSDVSPQRIIVFNGDTAKRKTLAKSGWDGAYVGKRIYYIDDNNGKPWLRSCKFDGSAKKKGVKMTVPKGFVYAGIVKAKKDSIVYQAMGAGTKKYKYAIKTGDIKEIK